MSNVKSEAVKSIADEIVHAIRTLTEKEKPYLVTSVGSYIANAVNRAENGDEVATNIITSILGYSDVNTRNATVRSAQIKYLWGSYADFFRLVADTAEIADARIQSVRADMATIVNAKIGTATIGFAQIRDAVAGQLIVQEGSANKFRIDSLTVTDANIANLTVGQLLLRDNINGKLQRLTTNSSGEPVLEDYSIDEDGIEDNAITNSKIVNGTISGGKIAGNTILASNINVGSLFSSDAFISNLITSTIESPSYFTTSDGDIYFLYKAIESTIEPTVSKTGQPLQNGDTWIKDIYEGITIVDKEFYEYYDGSWGDPIDGEFTDAPSKITLTEKMVKFVVGGNKTSGFIITQDAMNFISENITITAEKINLIADDIDLSGNETVSVTAPKINAVADNIVLGANTSVQIAVGNTKTMSYIAQKSDEIGWIVESGTSSSDMTLTSDMLSAVSKNIVLSADKIKLITNKNLDDIINNSGNINMANVAVSPSKNLSGVLNSSGNVKSGIELSSGSNSINITPSGGIVMNASALTANGTTVDINTETFSVSIPSDSESDELVVDKDGISANKISAGLIISESVVPAYVDNNLSLSGNGALAEFLSNLSGKFITQSISKTISNTTAGEYTITNVSGNKLTLNFGSGTINRLVIKNCSATIEIQNVTFNTTNRGVHIESSNVILKNCNFICDEGIYALYNSFVYASSCTGTCNTCIGAMFGATVYFNGSKPTGIANISSAEVYAQSDFLAPSSPPSPTTTTTIEITPSYTGTWSGDSRVSDDLYQGKASSSDKIRTSGIWFSTTEFSGKSIKSAVLTLRRYGNIGKSGYVSVNIYKTSTSSGSKPSLGNLHTTVNIAPDETISINVTDMVQNIASGTIKGFALYNNDSTIVGSGYTKGYCKIYGKGTSYPPQLTITYS